MLGFSLARLLIGCGLHICPNNANAGIHFFLLHGRKMCVRDNIIFIWTSFQNRTCDFRACLVSSYMFHLQCSYSTLRQLRLLLSTCWTWICSVLSCVSWNSRVFQWHKGNYCCDCCLLLTGQKFKELWFSYGAVVLVSIPELNMFIFRSFSFSHNLFSSSFCYL